MAKTISNTQHAKLLMVLGIVTELAEYETQPVKKGALTYCSASLLDMLTPQKGPTTPPPQAPPPSAQVLTITEAPDGTPRVNAKAHAAAVKAAATRKANKEKTADTAKPGDAAGTIKGGSRTAVSELTADSDHQAGDA